MFYMDEVFQHFVKCTNTNAELKRGADPDKHKGEWTDVILDEIKAYYGILLLMDIMNFERDELYWSNNNKHWLFGSSIGEILTRN